MEYELVLFDPDSNENNQVFYHTYYKPAKEEILLLTNDYENLQLFAVYAVCPFLMPLEDTSVQTVFLWGEFIDTEGLRYDDVIEHNIQDLIQKL